MIFVSAGHNPKGVKIDPGAVGNGFKEADIAVEFRNLVARELSKLGAKFITDKDDERLADYLKRIQTGSGSVVIEFHCDSAASSSASGTTGLVGDDADRLDLAFMKEINDTFSSVLQLPNRGVRKESESHRGRLGLMRKQGIVGLQEMFFISNKKDIEVYQSKKQILAPLIANIIVKYEKIIP